MTNEQYIAWLREIAPSSGDAIKPILLECAARLASKAEARSVEAEPAGALSIIVEWYKGLPKGAREKLSLANLHDLSKRLPLPAGWSHISSAPRDGTHIILAFGQDHACEGWWDDDDGEPRPWCFIDTADFNEVIINHSRDGEYGPSHWQPMPYREPRNRPTPPKA